VERRGSTPATSTGFAPPRELAVGGDDAVVVVTEPMCASVIADHYLDHAGPTRRAVAEAVVDRVVDASRFLVELCRDGRLAPGARLDDREVDDALTLHTACHATARDRESAGAVLLRLHGIDVDVVDGCCGAPGTGDHRAGVDRRSERFKLLVARSAAEDGPVASECSLACTTLARAGCRSVGHPISVVAERRGLGPDR
jgi:Fe-S oxidoreductase